MCVKAMWVHRMCVEASSAIVPYACRRVNRCRFATLAGMRATGTSAVCNACYNQPMVAGVPPAAVRHIQTFLRCCIARRKKKKKKKKKKTSPVS
eukprot:NODE_29892_length_433_cov_0.712418.p2 GENE.NODE_29892_length_433_cov_0.712418~~NODE_29892_length_433_cov_0.712418.p2  ORF type:complete len:94 (-),score=23.06 NODE_29892_length_433_cov_0.712418:114-395(-)